MTRRSEQSEASARTFALVASAARTAVVFRRGPSKRVQMLRWDLARDEVMPGQWLSGRIYDGRCGVSPNGRLVVYFAGKFKTELGTFTAVSRPPYFTALALWPDGSTHGGGGFFEGDRRLILNYARVIEELNGHAGVPADFEVSHVVEYNARRGANTPESAQGWTLTRRGVDGAPGPGDTMRVVFAEPWLSEKQNPVHKRLVLEQAWLGMFEVNGPSRVHSYRLVERDGDRERASEPLGRLDWAAWDHDGALLFGRDGCLFRRRVVATRSGERPAAVLVADLRANVFTNVMPPDAARVWP